MKVKLKHNKKRNVGLIYELFLKHMSNCLVDGDIASLKIATKILEKRFAKGTELYKEFRLFNALAQDKMIEISKSFCSPDEHMSAGIFFSRL